MFGHTFCAALSQNEDLLQRLWDFEQILTWPSHVARNLIAFAQQGDDPRLTR